MQARKSEVRIGACIIRFAKRLKLFVSRICRQKLTCNTK